MTLEKHMFRFSPNTKPNVTVKIGVVVEFAMPPAQRPSVDSAELFRVQVATRRLVWGPINVNLSALSPPHHTR